MRLSPFDDSTFYFQYLLGLSHLMQRQPERAVEWLRRSANHETGSPVPHFALASALGHLQKLEEGRRVMARLLELHAAVSVEWARRTRVHQIEADWEYVLDGARRVGLPETR